MAYWWVNHSQTSRAELDGGYIWSPRTRRDGGYNQTYENLRAVMPGDVVFSYAGAQVKAVGTASGPCRDAPKPAEFGAAGEVWADKGWLVPIVWTLLEHPVSPKPHMATLAPLLPTKYAPIRASGDGNQGCYLAAISGALGEAVLELSGAAPAVQIAEDAIEQTISASVIPETEKEQLVKARKGQGLFRSRVMAREASCRLTGITAPQLLVASHIKPWRSCSNAERLDGANGLMLAPHVDRLFDGGWITFADQGRLIARAEVARSALAAWGIPPEASIGALQESQAEYMAYHRAHVFLQD